MAKRGRPKMTMGEKLLREIKRREGMTKTEILKHLCRLSGKKFDEGYHAKFYRTYLHGDATRTGILENWTLFDGGETYSVPSYVKVIERPLTGYRY